MAEQQGNTEQDQQQEAPPMPIMQFEGEYITESEARLPAVVFELPEGYARGTVLRLSVEVRVKNVGYNENRKGDLARVHTLALNAVGLNAAFSPGQRRDDTEGSASGNAIPTAEDAEKLGVQFGRSSDAWGRPDSAVNVDDIEADDVPVVEQPDASSDAASDVASDVASDAASDEVLVSQDIPAPEDLAVAAEAEDAVEQEHEHARAVGF